MKAERFTVTKPELFYIFLALSSCYLLISYFTNNYLLTDDFYVSIWSEEFASDRVEQLLSTTKRIEWVIYLLTPIFLFLKMLLVAVSIQAGLYLGNIELSFKKVLQVVIVAELIPLLSTLIHYCYLQYSGASTFEEVNSFAPLSLLSLVRNNDLPSYVTYPLQQINFFELVYWVLLSLGLKIYLGKPFSKNFSLIASSYGVALLLWVLLVVFIQVQSS